MAKEKSGTPVEGRAYDVVLGMSAKRAAQIVASFRSREAADLVAAALNEVRAGMVDGEGLRAYVRDSVRGGAPAAERPKPAAATASSFAPEPGPELAEGLDDAVADDERG